MPASKPTDLPQWASSTSNDAVSGQSNKIEPPAAKKTGGWSYREKGARNWWNWWMNLVYQWMQYLDDYEENAHTWTALQTFSSGATTAEGAMRHADAVLQLGDRKSVV